MTQHPDEILKNVGPTVLFNMTGKFGKQQALEAMHRAASIFVMALEDMSGECPDDAAFYQVWAQTAGLPTAKSFILLKNTMITCGWIVRAERTAGPFLMITPKGQEKAVGFRKYLKEPTDADD